MAAPKYPKGGGIYSITHRESGRVYVGQTVSFRLRWNGHRVQANAGKHCNPHLQRAWSKHGEHAFVFDVLEIVADASLLTEREQHWINALDAVASGFNICPAAGSVLGRVMPDEEKASRSAAARLRGITPAQREALNRGHEARRGVRLTPEHIAKVVAAQIGRTPSAETREKIAAALRGKALPRDRVEKQRASLTGRKQPADEIERRRQSMLGHAVSEETRQRISAAHRGRPCPADRREKIAAKLAGHKQSPEQVAKRKATMDARTPEQIALWKARLAEANRRRYGRSSGEVPR